MYRKAILFADTEAAAQILETDSPARVKKLGREVRGFERSVWDKEKFGIVVEGNWCKFVNPVEGKGDGGKEGEGEEEGKGLSLREKLVATGERQLVEVSPFG